MTCVQMHARLPAAHCRHPHAEVPRQCEADMSGKTVSHQEETRELETHRPGSYRLYIPGITTFAGMQTPRPLGKSMVIDHNNLLIQPWPSYCSSSSGQLTELEFTPTHS